MEDLNFIDLFAGAGGFGLGFQLAGFVPLVSLEIDDWACETLRNNNNHLIVNKDIKHVSTPFRIKKLCHGHRPNVIIGGPPCQGFSVAGSNRVKNKEVKNNLFRDYLNWVKTLEPELFVIENVPGIISQKNKDGRLVIDVIRELSKKIGYFITVWQLNALNYGVPQSRERVFVIGTRKDVHLTAPKVTHSLPSNSDLWNSKSIKSAISVGEAIFDLPNIKAREGEEVMEYNRTIELSTFQKWARRGSRNVYNHIAMKHTERVVGRYQKILEGVEVIPDEFRVRKRNGGGELSDVSFNQNYRHLNPNNVSFTIPASFYSSFIHPTIPRNITAREAARLQSFPDKYVFYGKRTILSNSLLKKLGKEGDINLSQYNQIGNAVPPLLSKAVARRIKLYIKNGK